MPLSPGMNPMLVSTLLRTCTMNALGRCLVLGRRGVDFVTELTMKETSGGMETALVFVILGEQMSRARVAG